MATKANPKAGTSVVAWKAKALELAKKTSAAAATASAGRKAFSTKAGVLSFNDAPLPNNEVDAIIIGSVFENKFYVDGFDADNPRSPDCYAFASGDTLDPQKHLAPHEAVEEPQSEGCAKCEHNQFGSAEKGKGKACRNVRKLLLIPAVALKGGAAAIRDAEAAVLQVSVTSGRAWDAYVQQVANVYETHVGLVVTKVKVTPDPKTQFRIGFTCETRIEDDEVGTALVDRIEKASEELIQPYPSNAEEMPEEKPAARGGRGKQAPAKGGRAKY